MTAAKLAFGIGERVAMRVKFADIVRGRFSEEVRLRGDVAGERRTVYCGPVTEAITSLHAGGALASLEVPALPPGAEAVEFSLAQRDLVLERVAVPGTRRSKLIVQLDGATLKPISAGAPVPAAVPAATPPAVDACAAKRAAIVAAFGDAIDVAIAEYVPRLTAQHIAVTDDLVYRAAFTLFAAWRDAGCA